MSLHEVIKRRRPLRNINAEMREKRSRLDKIALWITERVGTMGFFIAIFTWTVLWLGWNLLASERLKFDPPMGFVFWLFLSNLIQILLMPLIMVGQNIIGSHAEARAENDLQINIKAEEEIEVILRHLELQTAILHGNAEKTGRRRGGSTGKGKELSKRLIEEEGPEGPNPGDQSMEWAVPGQRI